MMTKADALLTALDCLQMWGEPTRTEAENGLYPVADFENSAVYNNPDNWGYKPLGDNKILGGYPETGPKAASGSAGKNGQWAIQKLDNLSEGSQVLSKTDGAWVKYQFEGTRVRYITESAATGALVSVYIDGELIDQVVCWEPSSATNPRGVVKFDSEDYDLDLANETHELLLVGNTQPNAAHPIFRVDAFDEYLTKAQAVPKKALAKLIAEVSALSSSEYTDETWLVLRDKLQAAETVIADGTADEQMVTGALANLQNARDDLAIADTVITKVTPLMPVTIAFGTSAEQLDKLLQHSVVVTAGDKQIRLDVAWNLEHFNGKKAGKVTLEGELIIPTESIVSNPDERKASVEVTVQKGEANITLGNLKQTEGSVTPVTAKTEPNGLKVNILYEGIKTLPQKPGEYQVSAMIEDNNYEGAAIGTLIIDKKKVPVKPDKPEQPDKPVQGKTYQVGSYQYKVTSLSKKTVTLTGVTSKKLTKIKVAKSVKIKGVTFKITSIGKSAFKNCKKAKSAVIGKYVKTIGGHAFSGCKAMTKVTINSTDLTTIGSKAFYNCKKLKSIVIKSKKLKSVKSKAFKGIYKKAKIKVPKSKLKSYKKLLKGKGQAKTVKIVK